MPRLFISHSSNDNIYALAFKLWLVGKGWDEDDIFIDLHDMQAGEKWRETLVKANVACNAMLFLASPEALDSEECRREVRRAEDDRKDVIVAILRDLRLDDARLKPWMNRQIMDLSAAPLKERVEVHHHSRRHFVDFNQLALEAIHAKLIDWGHAPDSFAWPPKERPAAQPYPGLDALDELSAGIFFGREADIMSGIRDLRQMRHRGSPRLMVIQAASGAGKSSFLRAGLWPKLSRTTEFVPLAIVRPAKGVITGPQGLGKGLEDWFGCHRIRRSAGAINAELLAGDATAGAAKLASFMGEATKLVAEMRSLAAEDSRPPARPSILIAIDQGEELFAAEDAAENERFIAMLGYLLAHPPEGLDPYAVITIRFDSVDPLLQRVPKLDIDAPQLRPLPPLSSSAYRDVITRPAAVYARRVARLDIEPALVETLIAKATGADALPLLAFTLQRMFDLYHKEQRLTVADYDAMGGIEGSIDRALAEAQKAAGSAGGQDSLRRLLIPGLATWDPTANAAKRLVPNEAVVISGDRASLAPLANALVEKRLLTRGADTLEVAHEALLRRPLIDGWLQEQKDALKLRDDVLREAKEWAIGGRHADGLVRRGERLHTATALAGCEDFKSALAPASDYLNSCQKLERSSRSRNRWAQAAIYMLLLGIIGGMAARMNEDKLKSFYTWATVFRGHQLAAADLASKKPGDAFFECDKTYSTDRVDGKLIPASCPEMIVVPAGAFRMGVEESKRIVTIAQPFAVSRFTITFDQWDACVAGGGCEHNARPSDQTWGRGSRPAINVDWRDAQSYVAWLNRMTGGTTYRLLSEAEWEYAARGRYDGASYPWGNDIGAGYAHCRNCGSDFPSKTVLVGSFRPNLFSLYDMIGNVWQWVEDCYSAPLGEAAIDGSPVRSGCMSGPASRVIRGGSWNSEPHLLRFDYRDWNRLDRRSATIGFRVAKTLVAVDTIKQAEMRALKPSVLEKSRSEPTSFRKPKDQWILSTLWNDCANAGKRFGFRVAIVDRVRLISIPSLIPTEQAREGSGTIGADGSMFFTYEVCATGCWSNLLVGHLYERSGSGFAMSLKGGRVLCSGSFEAELVAE